MDFTVPEANRIPLLLLECGDFSHIRNKHFHVDTIKQLFNDVPIDNVFLFLKEINLFNKL